MAPVTVTLNDLEGHSRRLQAFSSAIRRTYLCSILPDSTDSVLERFLSDSWSSYTVEGPRDGR